MALSRLCPDCRNRRFHSYHYVHPVSHADDSLCGYQKPAAQENCGKDQAVVNVLVILRQTEAMRPDEKIWQENGTFLLASA
jgi:hypothetical protein